MEVSTEAVTVEQVGEMIKNTDPGVFETYLKGLIPGAVNFGFQVVLAIIVYLIGTRLIIFASKVLRKWLERREAEEGVKQFLNSLLKASLFFVLIVTILTFFGVSTASVAAVLGSAGLALGLALQGSLANFAGGVLLLLLRPFRVGDYIIEDTHGNEGTVDEISIFYTKLLTVDHKTIVIPNGILANSSLTNVTSSEKRRVDLFVGISYESDIRLAKEILNQLALEEKDRLEEEEINVFVSELGASEVTLGLRIWVKTEDYWNVKWRMTEQIKYAFDEKQIEIPYQKMDVSIRQ